MDLPSPDQTSPYHFRGLVASIAMALCVVVALAVLSGGYAAAAPWLAGWVEEDGPVEWLTVAGLLWLAILCFHRVAVLRARRAKAFLVFTFMAGLAFLFGAGEEISWGQRLLGLGTPEWFMENNRQAEINLHNLVIGGQDMTKLMFGKVLTFFLLGYLLVLPLAYEKSPRLGGLLDRAGLPVPRAWHAALFLLLSLVTYTFEIPGRESELFEFAAVGSVLLAFIDPGNPGPFRRQG